MLDEDHCGPVSGADILREGRFKIFRLFLVRESWYGGLLIERIGPDAEVATNRIHHTSLCMEDMDVTAVIRGGVISFRHIFSTDEELKAFVGKLK